MPVGLPKVPFRLPGEENAVWVDVYVFFTDILIYGLFPSLSKIMFCIIKIK